MLHFSMNNGKKGNVHTFSIHTDFFLRYISSVDASMDAGQWVLTVNLRQPRITEEKSLNEE